MDFPSNLLYTKDHEWVLIEQQYALIGITDFAQRELGDIVFIDIPSLNQVIEKEAVFGTVEAVKTVSDLYMPITGKIVAVNDDLGNHPELVNKAAYDSWIIKVLLDAPSDRSNLLSAEEYGKLVL
jgi:glycine cleavage system H protein